MVGIEISQNTFPIERIVFIKHNLKESGSYYGKKNTNIKKRNTIVKNITNCWVLIKYLPHLGNTPIQHRFQYLLL